MKKVLYIFIALVVLILMAGAIFIILISKAPEKLLLSPENLTTINYNNYIFDNVIDYKGNKIAWLKSNFWGSNLAVLDDKDCYNYVDDIDAPFQLYNDQIVYVKKNKLYLKSIDSGKSLELVTDVDKFVVYQDYIIYDSVRVFNDDTGEWKKSLFVYDISSKNKRIVYKNINQFYIHNDKLFAKNNDDELVEISFDNDSVKQIIRIKTDVYPFYVMPQGNGVLYLQSNRLCLMDLKTGTAKSVFITGDSYVNNKINYICDDDNIFLSFQATKTNGSVVTNIDDENNGVWKIEPQTMKTEKLCLDTFERLYLFDKECLLGEKDTSIYKIDLKTKQSVKISN